MEGEAGSRSGKEMTKGKTREGKSIVFTGTAVVAAVAVGFAVNAVISALSSRLQKHKKNDLPGSKVRINLSASQIRKLSDHIIAKSKAVHDALASVPVDKVTYDNVASLANFEAEYFPLIQSCIFPKFVSPSDEIRQASAEAERSLDAHASMCRKREDVYSVIKALTYRGECLSADSMQFIRCLIRDFEQNGLHLNSAKREEVQRLRAQIDELSRQYVQNINNDCTSAYLEEKELDGLPSDFLQKLDRGETGSFKINLRSNHVCPVLELCKVGETRRKIAVAYGQKCKEVNVSLLENLVQLRHKYARLLGFKNYADYVASLRMAKTSSKIFEFLEEISSSSSELAAKELQLLKEFKMKEEGESSFGFEDLLYYVKKCEEETFDVDVGDLKHYLPTNVVLCGILKLFQDLFGLRFDEAASAEVWHQDVRAFSVMDLSSSELLGYVYLDLFSREGKYDHTCVVPLQNGSALSNGTRQVAVLLLISGFRKEVFGQPGLLRFSEVVNLFHKFGHVIHHICNCASLPRFSGLRVDPDFVEIPSLVLENWCYESSILKLISGFHQDITRPISDDVCSSLKRWRYSFSALKLRQEILYCLFDQIIHSEEDVDFLELFKYLHPKVMLGLPVLEGTDPASCFPHSAIGYEASCYSRIWSKVFAADIFHSKFKDNLLNQYIGLQFRSKVLAPGGAKDPVECLSDFLGREPSIQAFIDSLALSSS